MLLRHYLAKACGEDSAGEAFLSETEFAGGHPAGAKSSINC
jgi:hypothetical protein